MTRCLGAWGPFVFWKCCELLFCDNIWCCDLAAQSFERLCRKPCLDIMLKSYYRQYISLYIYLVTIWDMHSDCLLISSFVADLLGTNLHLHSLRNNKVSLLCRLLSCSFYPSFSCFQKHVKSPHAVTITFLVFFFLFFSFCLWLI